MKKPLSLAIPVLVLAGLAFLTWGCGVIIGSGHMTDATRAVNGFAGIALQGTGTVKIAFGEKEELRIEAEDNLIPYLETTVANSILSIGTRSGTWIQPTTQINYYVTIKTLDSLSLGGSGRIEAPDFKTGRLRVAIGGSGELALANVDAGEMTLAISGSGKLSAARINAPVETIELSGSGSFASKEWLADRVTAAISGSGAVGADAGKIREQRVTISGSGAYRCARVEGETAVINISGSGQLEVRVSKKLDVDVSGSGEVRYSGRPEVKTSITGSGKVVPAGE